MSRLIYHPLAPLCLFAAALSGGFIACLVAGSGISPGLELLASSGWTLLALCWIVADARRCRQVPCFDFGLFCWICFPLSLLWYCIWSRGWGGLLMLALLLGLWLVPYVIAAAAWAILYRRV